MTRIVLRIDRLELHGIDASEGEAVTRALQDTLAHALRERVDAMPSAATVVAALQAVASGARTSTGTVPATGSSAADSFEAGALQARASGASGVGRGTTHVTAGHSPAALGASVAQGIVRRWLP
jgi:hypothetical protein